MPATLISSSVGNDYYGERVIEQLSSTGLAAGQRVKPGLRTPLEVGIVDASGSRTYFQRREPHVMSSLAIPSVAQLSGARMLYVDWYDGSGILGAMERARSQAFPVFLNLESRYYDNPQLREPAGLDELVPSIERRGCGHAHPQGRRPCVTNLLDEYRLLTGSNSTCTLPAANCRATIWEKLGSNEEFWLRQAVPPRTITLGRKEASIGDNVEV